ncbi:MAG: restriction endonuclease subunit S [Firmicutes bacterium]|jgi:type I restriction enzyme S subunit|nr:restriction endonuclease subunit S [Bacillota bacterium]
MKFEWKEYTIGDLCDTISDTYKRNDEEVILINTSDVLDGNVLNHKAVKNKNLKGQFKKTFRHNDILYSEIRPANKRFAFVDFDNTEKYIASTKLMVLRAHEDVVLPQYLFAILKSQKVIETLQHLAETRSGTFPQITFSSELAPMNVMLPNIVTQKQIIAILSVIECKIKLNNEINANLEQQAQAIFKSWFVDFEPFGGTIPETWFMAKLGDIASIKTTSFSPAKNPDVILEHYSIPAFDKNKYPVFELAKEVKSNKYILTSKSIMISKLNPNTKRVWRPMYLTEFAVSSTEFIIFEANNPIYKDFIYSIIDSVDFMDWMCAHTTGSTNSRQRTIPSTTLEFKVPIACDEIISEFCAIVSPMYDKISQNICENQKLVKIRDILLPKLMSGEIDVSDITI